MTQFTATVQELGRIAIPIEVRNIDDINPGDVVVVDIVRVKRA